MITNDVKALDPMRDIFQWIEQSNKSWNQNDRKRNANKQKQTKIPQTKKKKTHTQKEVYKTRATSKEITQLNGTITM